MAAVRGEHAAAVTMLLKAGAAPLLENYADTTALDIAQVVLRAAGSRMFFRSWPWSWLG